jgi:sugar phosphate isomerase/epimerase
MISRRQILKTGAAVLGAAATSAGAAAPKIRIGAMDGVLKMGGRVDAFALAAKLGLEGVEVNLGRARGAEALTLADPELQAKYLAASTEHKVAIAGVVLSVLHQNYFKSDKLALKWVHDAIPIARNLRVRVLLLPFFGPAAIENRAERERVADLLKEFVPVAKKAGIILGIENTLSAEDNAALLERAGSKSIAVYYDVANSTNMGGFDAPQEIRWLGKNRICQIHLKDKGYLGEGKVNFPEVMRAIRDIGYRGFANLETSSPSGSMEADVRRNLAYVRGLMREYRVG